MVTLAVAGPWQCAAMPDACTQVQGFAGIRHHACGRHHHPRPPPAQRCASRTALRMPIGGTHAA